MKIEKADIVESPYCMYINEIFLVIIQKPEVITDCSTNNRIFTTSTPFRRIFMNIEFKFWPLYEYKY